MDVQVTHVRTMESASTSSIRFTVSVLQYSREIIVKSVTISKQVLVFFSESIIYKVSFPEAKNAYLPAALSSHPAFSGIRATRCFVL